MAKGGFLSRSPAPNGLAEKGCTVALGQRRKLPKLFDFELLTGCHKLPLIARDSPSVPIMKRVSRKQQCANREGEAERNFQSVGDHFIC